MKSDRVAVIGAGVGGLVAAIELARSGADVTVFERAPGPGGKMREAHIDGVRIDAGPTVLTMRWVFDEIFRAAGSTLDRYVALAPLDILARHAWSSEQRLDIFACERRTADAIGAFAGASEARGFLAFSAEARRIHDILRAPFLEASKPTPLSLTCRIGLHKLGDLFAIRPFETMWQALSGHFRDPRLRQLFGRYATYCGSSPFDAPATLMLIAHVEQAGVWSVAGGMHQLAVALEQLARAQGARFRYDAHVSDIAVRNGRVSGVLLRSGERIDADAVIVNADPAALAAGAFGPDAQASTRKAPRRARSLSAMTWALQAETTGFPLTRHNVFFSSDYAAEFSDLFSRHRPPQNPTIYVCAQDRSDDAPNDDATDRLLVLINAPPVGDTSTPDPLEIAQCETRTFDHLARCGLKVKDAPRAITTPHDFHTLFPATGGSLYGRASHGWMASFQRPGARTRIQGLYLAGGSTHPGAGVPMAALSGRLAARTALEDRASISQSSRAVTPGGTLTPSATTADLA